MDRPEIAGKSPQMEKLEADKTYAWCACGKSEKQPWCDGSHKSGDLRPKVFKKDAAENAAMCMCKQTSNPPYCDGSHNRL